MTEAATQPRKRRAYAPRVPLEERRAQLRDAALRLIAREGYGAVTIEAIAAEAGVTKPVVYGAYDKLPDLLGDLLDRTQQDALSQLLAAFPHASADTPSAAEVARSWAAAVRKHPDTWAPVLLTGAQTPQVVLERIEVSRRLVCDTIASLFAEGRTPTRRQRFASQAIIAVAEHFGRALLLSPAAITDDELADLVDDLVRGALARTYDDPGPAKGPGRH